MNEKFPRVTKHFGDGRSQPVPADDIHGDLNDFVEAITSPVEHPDPIRASGWQGPDDNHPAGTGTPAYRLAYKTLGLVPFPSLNIEMENLYLRVQNGSLQRGGMRAVNTLPGRRSGNVILPQYGRLVDQEGGVAYQVTQQSGYHFAGWEETVEDVNLVEVIFLPSDIPTGAPYEVVLEAGRQGLSRFTAFLDLTFGPRLLAMPMLEEVGETFDDWHWSRRLDAEAVVNEAAAIAHPLDAHALRDKVELLFLQSEQITSEERTRLNLASRWYWSAIGDVDPIRRFVQWWLVIETLLMESTNISPVVSRLTELPGCAEGPWKVAVGRLFGLRSKIVHGKAYAVNPESEEFVELLAQTLLADALSGSSPELDSVAKLLELAKTIAK